MHGPPLTQIAWIRISAVVTIPINADAVTKQHWYDEWNLLMDKVNAMAPEELGPGFHTLSDGMAVCLSTPQNASL